MPHRLEATQKRAREVEFQVAPSANILVFYWFSIGNPTVPSRGTWIFRKCANWNETNALRTSQRRWNRAKHFYKPINMINYDRFERPVSLSEKFWPLELLSSYGVCQQNPKISPKIAYPAAGGVEGFPMENISFWWYFEILLTCYPTAESF